MKDKEYLYLLLNTQLMTMALATLNVITTHMNGNYPLAIISAILAGGLAGFAINTYKEVNSDGLWMWNL